jgi:hypothetical protein
MLSDIILSLKGTWPDIDVSADKIIADLFVLYENMFGLIHCHTALANAEAYAIADT